jgi:hypothetical protein
MRRTLLLLVVLTGCSSGNAAPAALPTVTGATVVKVQAARTLCSGNPPKATAPTAKHTVGHPNVVAGLHRSPKPDATAQEYANGLVGSGQSLRLLAEYDGTTAHVKAVVLSTAPGDYGTDRLAYLCRSATGYVTADATSLHQSAFPDDLVCFEIPKDAAKPVLCSWYDDTAGTLTLTGVRGAPALDLAVAFRAALEQPVS